MLNDAARILLTIAAITLAMLCLRVAWDGVRNHEPSRIWTPIAGVLLLATPISDFLLSDDPLPLVPTLLFAGALICGGFALHRIYTIHPEWTRARLAAERDLATSRRRTTRATQDTLRADDRTAQAGERADSRAMHDAGHLDESTAAYDHRVEVREEQDANREHSHGLQDHERDVTRRDEDRA